MQGGAWRQRGQFAVLVALGTARAVRVLDFGDDSVLTANLG